MKLVVHTNAGRFRRPLFRTRAGATRFSRRQTGGGHQKSRRAGPRRNGWHGLTTQALKDVLAGRNARALPPLDLSAGTEFQQAVWKRVAAHRDGENAELRRSGRRTEETPARPGPWAAPAVLNPIPVLVPCHRVLAANRQLGGFSSGLDWKRKLLAREAVAFTEDTRFDLETSELKKKLTATALAGGLTRSVVPVRK